MNRKVFLFVILVLILDLLGCSSMRVLVKYDQEIDFSNYKTFHFVRMKQKGKEKTGIRNPLFTKEVMNEIRPVMENKGFTEAKTTEEADLLLHFNAMVKEKREYVQPTYRVGRWGRTRVVRPGHVVKHKIGTLVIDIVDRQKKELVWQGVGKGLLNRSDPGQNFVKAVEEILEKFPPEM
jgi:hypothetical protein